MSLEKAAALVALLAFLTTNAAHAGIEVWALVNNQTSSAVSLSGSSTRGMFLTGPQSSIAANTRIGAATTWTFDYFEDGHLTYGPCSIYWDVDYYFLTIYSSVFAQGPGCTAAVLGEIPNGYDDVIVVVELTIT